MTRALTVGEVAQWTGFSRPTVRRALERSQASLGVHRTPGGHWRVAPWWVQEWAKSLGHELGAWNPED